MKLYKELSVKEREQYWSLLRIYELAQNAIDNEPDIDERFAKQDQFYRDIRDVQEYMNIELFTERVGLGKVSANYICDYGNPFCEVCDDPKGGKYISYVWGRL